MLWLNIRKRQGSNNVSEGGALMDCLSAPAYEWKEDYSSMGHRLIARQALQTVLVHIRDAIHNRQCASFADVRPLFARLTVESRRGYWRISFDPGSVADCKALANEQKPVEVE